MPAIKFDEQQRAKGLRKLILHGDVYCLPDHIFIVSPNSLRFLDEANISYTFVKSTRICFDFNLEVKSKRIKVNEMITNPLIEQGRQQGIQQGRQQGIQQGIQEGVQLGKQSLLLQLLSAKFGQLPESVVQKIRAMTGEHELDKISLRVLTANSLAEMGLDGQVEP